MKKIFQRFIFGLLAVLLILLSVVLISFSNSGQLGRYVIYGNADLDDHTIFASRALSESTEKFSFIPSPEEKGPSSIKSDGKRITFEEYLKKNETVAFLVIRNDSILYERYFDGYERSSVIPSFSIAKSFTATLIGCAIDDGLIRSVQDPVTDYLPELKEQKGFEQISLEHLLQMTSGIAFNESYVNPFGGAASVYYGNDLKEVVYDLQVKDAPGQSFDYISVNTQILGMVLEKVLAPRTVTEYLQERIWQPVGMEYDASWSIDAKDKGMEKTFCCLNARACDFAKLGRLYLRKGDWEGRQIVSPDWVERSTRRDTKNGSHKAYQYHWWIPSDTGAFMAEGILGQYVYVNPANRLIIVRMGAGEGDGEWWDLFNFLSNKYY